jgi:hypothetical protein
MIPCMSRYVAEPLNDAVRRCCSLHRDADLSSSLTQAGGKYTAPPAPAMFDSNLMKMKSIPPIQMERCHGNRLLLFPINTQLLVMAGPTTGLRAVTAVTELPRALLSTTETRSVERGLSLRCTSSFGRSVLPCYTLLHLCCSSVCRPWYRLSMVPASGNGKGAYRARNTLRCASLHCQIISFLNLVRVRLLLLDNTNRNIASAFCEGGWGGEI